METVCGSLDLCFGEFEGVFTKLKNEVALMQARVESSEKEKRSVLAKNLELEENNDVLKSKNASYLKRIDDLGKEQAKEKQRVSDLQRANAVKEADAIKAINAIKGDVVKANAALKKAEEEKVRLGFLVSAWGEAMESATVKSVTEKIRLGFLVSAWEEAMESATVAWQKILSQKDAELMQLEAAKDAELEIAKKTAKKRLDRRIEFWRKETQTLEARNLKTLERLRTSKRSIKSLEKICKKSDDEIAVLERAREFFKKNWQDCSRELKKQKKTLNAANAVIATKQAVIVTREEQLQRAEGLYKKMKEEDALKAEFVELVQVVDRVVGRLRAARESDSNEKDEALTSDLDSYTDFVEGMDSVEGDVENVPDFEVSSFESRPDARVASLGKIKEMLAQSGERIFGFVAKEAAKGDKKAAVEDKKKDALEAKKRAKREREKEKKKEKKKERKKLAIEMKKTGNSLTYEHASLKPSGNFVPIGSPGNINWVREPTRGQGTK